jgi:phage gp36-like protein
MPYVAQADIASRVPGVFLTQALDDDGDGDADSGVWDSIATTADNAVDAILGLKFEVPFSAPLPPIVTNAAQTFALEVLYQRRGITGEQNPWTLQADAMRKTLRDIAAGKLPLAPDKKPVNAAGTLIKETAKAYDSKGRRLA